MATDRQRAALDLNAKLRLEVQLRPRIERVNRKLVRQVTRSLGNEGTLPDVEGISREELEPILAEHYLAVGAIFSRRTRGQLSGGARMTDEESAAVDAALAEFFDRRVPDQARQIGGTNARDASDAVVVAELERRRLVDEGAPMPSRREEALIVGAVFSRKLGGRTTSIVMLETQAPAEASKQTEVDVLLGNDPAVLGGDPTPDPRSDKEWATQGDQRVRQAHLDADSDIVPANQPFTVGGQFLMYPGDTSLGATVDNVINCRCSSLHDTSAIASARTA